MPFHLLNLAPQLVENNTVFLTQFGVVFDYTGVHFTNNKLLNENYF